MIQNISLVIAIVLGVGNFIGFVYIVGWKLGRLTLKVDTIWDFLIRRGTTEGQQKNLFTVNSPIKLTDETRQAYGGMLTDLKAFYEKAGRFISNDADLAMEIERQFGDRLVKDICPVLGIQYGACLVVARELVKEMGSRQENAV